MSHLGETPITPDDANDHLTESRRRRTAEPEKKKKKRTALKVLLGFLLVVVLAAAAAVFYLGSLASSFDTKTPKIAEAFPEESTRPTATADANGKTPLNILLVGTDSREATAEEAESGGPSDQRSDTMMVLHVTADRKNAYLVSLMRDLWVPIPGHGEAKLNAAMAFGGVPLMVQSIESLLQQRMDHVAFIDFEGFKGLTDALGGVEVNVPVAFDSYQMKGKRFEEGTQTLDGEEALAFVRERYAFADGDYQRVRNQQIFLKAVMSKMVKPETLANPVTVSKLVDQFSPFVTVDKTLDAGKIGSLGIEMRDIRPSQLVSFTLPTGGTGTSADGQSIVLLDQSAVTQLSEAMAKGTVPAFVDQRGLKNGN